MSRNSLIGMFRDAANEVHGDMNRIIGKDASEGTITPPMVPGGGRPNATWHPTTPEEAAQAAAVMQAQKKACIAVLENQDAEENPSDPEAVKGCLLFMQTYFPNEIPGEEGGGDDPIIDDPQPPSAGSMLDLSSPMNTIVKAVFFSALLSPMVTGTLHYYFISAGCMGAILYSLIKISKQQ